MQIIEKTEWTQGLTGRIASFLSSLNVDGRIGRYRSCIVGPTESGRQLSLGFSCLGLKINYTLGLWDTLGEDKRREWVQYIQSFQLKNITNNGIDDGAFVDKKHLSLLDRSMAWHKRFLLHFASEKRLSVTEKLIVAETKQAISTLAQVQSASSVPYRGFPMTEQKIDDFLNCLNWSMPWSAGGVASALAVFLVTEAPRLKDTAYVLALKKRICEHFKRIADPLSGGYFTGQCPEEGQLINGAMKVLTALDWLDEPIHYPERLIDTCLKTMPYPEGCHMVDWVYVLYRSTLQSSYRLSEVQSACMEFAGMIQRHHNPDGGFSSRIEKAKSHYYGLRVSKGEPESDIHGTCLLSWALAMVFELTHSGESNWRVIKP